jgi:hypothetical protein
MSAEASSIALCRRAHREVGLQSPQAAQQALKTE